MALKINQITGYYFQIAPHSGANEGMST